MFKLKWRNISPIVLIKILEQIYLLMAFVFRFWRRKVQGCCNLDHHKDTLIFSKIINTNILEGKKIDGDLIFEDIKLEGLLLTLKLIRNEKRPTNLMSS
jgi:hypothetical protein